MGWFLACLAFAAAVLLHFHNQQWNYYDDGTYLHVADRLLHGEVLHRDVQDMHAGYINFANALALKLFGNDTVSLRYPLVVMGMVNAALAFWLLRGAGISYAVTASVAGTALSCIQFMNPSAHWYALFLMLIISAVLMRCPPKHGGCQVVLGVLVGLIFLFRQLSGVFAAIGVLLCLLLELPEAPREARTWAARALIAVAGLGLAGYLFRTLDAVAFVMYGIAPLIVILQVISEVKVANRDVARMILRLSIGGALAALPLLAYHVYHGSLRFWFEDTVVAANSVTRLEFFDYNRYWTSMMNGARSLVHPASGAQVLMGLFWVLAPALPVVLGVMVVRSFLGPRGSKPPLPATDRSGDRSRWPPTPSLALLALFYFPVALHLQKFMYLFFALPLVVLGLLAMAPALRPLFRRTLLGVVWTVTAIGFVYMAGPIRSLVPGRSTKLVAGHGIPRCSIWLEPFQVDVYRHLISLVDREVASDETILALPVAPELYYLTGRRNPTRFYLSAIGLRSPGDVSALIEKLERSPPKLVFYNPRSTYITPECRHLRDWVVQHYDAIGTHGVFNVFRYRPLLKAGSTQPGAPEEGVERRSGAAGEE